MANRRRKKILSIEDRKVKILEGNCTAKEKDNDINTVTATATATKNDHCIDTTKQTTNIRNKVQTTMGTFLSKPPPDTVKPRNPDRVKSAREHIEPIIDQLSALNDKIEGKVLVAPSSSESDPDEAEQYHSQRERPFYFNDCNYPSAIVLIKTIEDVCETIKFINSLDGAAIVTSVSPALGSKVYVGKMLGEVVRYVENGLAIRFLTGFGSDLLADIVEKQQD